MKLSYEEVTPQLRWNVSHGDPILEQLWFIPHFDKEGEPTGGEFKWRDVPPFRSTDTPKKEEPKLLRELVADELIANGEFSSSQANNYVNALLAADAIIPIVIKKYLELEGKS